MTPTQKQAMEMARDYIAERPEDRKISAGKVVATLTAALSEQADDKAVRYGCHCDLEPHMEPDGCVLDEGKPENCVYARRPGATKEGCEYWKPIVIAARSKP